MTKPEAIAVGIACISLFGTLLNISVNIFLYYSRKKADKTDAIRKSAVLFYSKIDQCLSEIDFCVKDGVACICHES